MTNYRTGKFVVKDKLLADGVPKYLALPPKNSNKNKNKKLSIKDRPTSPDKSHPSKGGVDSLTNKASQLNIGTADRKLVQDNGTSAGKKPLKVQIMPNKCLQEINREEVRRSPRILAKRVRSVVDEVRGWKI